jgi:hypothetical protein
MTVNGALLGGSRFPFLVHAGQRTALREWCLLLGLGALAALIASLLEFRLKIPGHAILRGVLPITLGLALVPRRFAGSVMGVSALLTALALPNLGGRMIGAAALTTLVLIGPMLDLALWHARPGWRLYLRLALAGMLCNCIALGAHLLGPWLGVPSGGGGMRASWPLALFTYPLFGLLAGLAGAFCWFRAGGSQRTEPRL